ncbi:MAG: nucleotidyltransferase family protein [Candidatus Marinimicrobia bacterium]|nr:nucleotidyltransferase family protein [Candidatus Neomarinimicrobiota bacterium]
MSSTADSVNRVAAVVLAAGGSTRMQAGHKLLLPVNGRPMIATVVDQVLAADFRPLVVVTGFNGHAIIKALEGLSVQVVANRRWRQGLATSLKCGLKALPAEATGALFVLADMPLVDVKTLVELRELFTRRGCDAIVYPAHQGRQGNPVLFPRRFFSEIMALKGDRGAQGVLRRHAADSIALPVDSRAVLVDFDTDQDYADLQLKKNV